ncbi:MAG TPA: secondary thiamine-phosphate synthase enzyme YjbQ [Nitrosopumilaceae archaeon]|nr:secondary thiamine-phosphate synthase enzyme YjbQ [Nitrosopumilaceae archaeon]
MAVITKRIKIHSKSENDIIDITEKVADAVLESGLGNGTVTVFVVGSTGAVTTLEYEPGLLRDLPAALGKIAPDTLVYEHEKRWHDGNGRSHVKASLVGPSLVVPFCGGELVLGQWQQIVFLELDTRSRSRELVLQIVGE